jgi:hypothetical protein
MPLIHAQTPRVNALAGGRSVSAAKAAVKNFRSNDLRPPTPDRAITARNNKNFLQACLPFCYWFSEYFYISENCGLRPVIHLLKLFISLYVRQRTAPLGTHGDNDCQEQKVQSRILLKLCAKQEFNIEGGYCPTAVSNKQQINASPRSRCFNETFAWSFPHCIKEN